jgi:hypothetical protein
MKQRAVCLKFACHEYKDKAPKNCCNPIKSVFDPRGITPPFRGQEFKVLRGT